MAGDQNDIFLRVKATLPRWFGDSTPVLDSVIQGVANVLAYAYSQYAYAKAQTRLMTMSGGWLDLFAADFLGSGLRRRTNETDAQYRARIIVNLFRERATRRAITKVLLDLTGRAPLIVEPQRPADTGVYGGSDSIVVIGTPQIFLFDWQGNHLLSSSPRTNLMTYSEHLANSPISGVTSTIGALTAPDGSLTMDKFVETTANSTHYLSRNVTLAVASYTWSIFAKGAGRNIRLRATGIGALVEVNLTTGAVTGTGSTGYISSSSTAVPGAAGVFRITLTLSCTSPGTQPMAKYLLSGVNTDTYTGDGVSGVYLWGEQVEPGLIATSYFPSLDTFVSRASTGTYVGPNGWLLTAAANVARMQYNPSNLNAAPKLLLEPAATNIFTYSDGSVGQLQVSGNVVAASTAIIGFANSIQFGDNSVVRYAYKSSVGSTVVAAQYTLSYFVQMDDGGVPIPGAPNAPGADFVFNYEATASAASGVVVYVGNNIYRCSLTFIATSAGNVNNGIAKYTSQSPRGFRVTGYQLQVGPYADSYIPTGSAAVTRAADISTSLANTVTDYTVNAAGDVLLAQAPVVGATLLWSGSYSSALQGRSVIASGAIFGGGDGSNTSFSLAPKCGYGAGYGVAGAYGSLLLPSQAFVTIYRPLGSGIPNVAGYGIPTGAYSTASQSDYANINQVTGSISDADLLAAVDSVKPAGTTIWVRIQS